MKDVVIIAAQRTPMGSYGGVFAGLSATDLGAVAIKAALESCKIDKSKVEEVIMGNVLQANLGQAPARQASKKAGLDDSTVANTINKVCASGMKAVMMATQDIKLGDYEVVVAGGMESMSNVPYYNPDMRWGSKFGDRTVVDGLSKDGLTDVYNNFPMGNAAEMAAEKYNISREDQDKFAIESYKRSQKAWEENKFKDEVAPVSVPQRKGDPIIIDKDEEPSKVSFEKIPTLRPAFQKDGTVTAANSSTMNDGAAALILTTAEKAAEMGIKPLARVLSYADAEQAPEWFTTSPALALPKAVKKAGLEMKDLDFVELNEAFSVVGVANTMLLELDHNLVNIHGGAVSLGHPLGCSGARIIVSLIHILQQNNGKYGGAAICNGGGGASAIIIEKL